MQDKGLNMLFILLLVITILIPSQAVKALIPAAEVDALLELKDHLGDSRDSKALLGAWDANNTQHICKSWAGVTCTSTGDHIYGINLGGFELSGSLPPHLGNLTFLVTLDLSSNNLSGVIPAQLSGCISLEVLDLSHNHLSGPIPSSLSSLSSLLYLDLCHNTLNGSIPPYLFTNSTSLVSLSLCNNELTGPLDIGIPWRLPHLQDFLVQRNHLTGAIPSSVTNCTSLQSLVLGDNPLSGQIPKDIGALGNLKELLLFNNNLRGAIPPSLGNCTQLLEIALYSNQLIGPVPTVLSSHLYTLYLHENHLTGPLPSSWSNCKSLIFLALEANHLNGSIPTEFGALSSLRELSIEGNNLKGAIPPTLSNCTYLTMVELHVNQLTGPIPAELGLLPHLQILGMAQNRFTGAIPSSLGNCTQLIALDLSSNQLSGFIPPEITMLPHMKKLFLGTNHLLGFKSLRFSNYTSLLKLELQANNMTHNILPKLGNLQQLQWLNLGGNQFSREISWEFLTNCSSLFYLDLSDNYFSGRIANSLGKLQKLGHLMLQGNLLEGTIPNFEEFPQFTSLSKVDLSYNFLDGPLPQNLLGRVQISLELSHNNFSGNLPSWMGELEMLEIMDFSNNFFVGDIPNSLGDCLNLKTLNLSHNNLSGVIPMSLGNLSVLQTLDLSNNKLTGVLPPFLQHLDHLQFLNVSNNNLNGNIPNVGVFKHLNASCFQGNSGLCGTMIQKKCMKPFERHHNSNSHQLNWKTILFIALASSTVGIMLLVVALSYIYPHCHNSLPINHKFNLLASVEKYTAKELVEATQGYSEENILGEGALGRVYKGILSNGKVVAVKKFKDVCSRQALLQEMQILCRLRHRNLVRVFGCVLNLDVNALVLDFMPNGSLENYMHEDEHEPKELSWEMLRKTATGVANALTYLHHEYGVPIIHGDVKPSNILLDFDLEAHLADFGLAKLVKGEAISLSSNFKGSIGYMAPEYAYAARITTKVDVYSFGVVVLEMLTGKRATQLNEGSLHEWVKSKLVDMELTEVLQASLLQNVLDEHMALQLLKMGVACTEENPGNRPTMQKVSSLLISKKEDRYDL